MGKSYAIAAIVTMLIGSGYILYTTFSPNFSQQTTLVAVEPVDTNVDQEVTPVTPKAVTKPVTTQTLTQEYKNTVFGFSVSYPTSWGPIIEKKRLGLIMVNDKTVSAPDTLNYSQFSYFVSGGKNLGDKFKFAVEGKDFMTFSEGFPSQKVSTTCKTGIDPDTNQKSTYPCLDKMNANGTHYYYIDSYTMIIGQVHLALFPLANGSVLYFLQSRIDSDEVAGTEAEVEAFKEIVDSVKF